MSHELELEIALPCSPAAAFRAWTDGAEILRWWGEDGVYRTIDWEADLQPGGRWLATFEGDGATFTAQGEYLAVSAPDRLDWTWSADWAPGAVSTIAMTFSASPEGTRLRLRNFGFETAREAEESKEGWDQILGWLTAYLTH